MKYTILFICLLLYSSFVLSQKEQHETVFEADSTWGKEIIKFPLGFARGIKYEGFEDIRFAKGWKNKENPEFWTYVFAWHIKGIKKQSAELLEKHITMYFDGISRPDNNDTRVFPMATVLFIENEEANNETDYIGKLRIYDRFNTKDMISLYCRVKTYYCKAKDTSTIVFKFSHRPFKDAVWQKFKKVKLVNGCEG